MSTEQEKEMAHEAQVSAGEASSGEPTSGENPDSDREAPDPNASAPNLEAEAIVAAEAAVFKHLFARYYSQSVNFSYWRGKKDHEIDLVAAVAGRLIPFEVKYRSKKTTPKDIKGLVEFCQQKNIQHGYVITKSIDDIGQMTTPSASKTKIMRPPAAFLCYWMGKNECISVKN